MKETRYTYGSAAFLTFLALVNVAVIMWEWMWWNAFAWSNAVSLVGILFLILYVLRRDRWR